MAKDKGIPEKIELDGKEYSVKDNPELVKIIESVRKDEKDRLYSTIQTLKSEKKVLEDEKKSNGSLSEENEAKLKELQDELAVTKAEKVKVEKLLDGKKKGNDDDDDEDDKKKGKKQGKTNPGVSKEDFEDLLAEKLEAQRKQFEEKLKEVRGGLTKKEVKDYRKEKIAENKGLLIEKLVPENLESEEEVNKAISEALAESKKYITKEYDVEGKKQKLTIAEYEELEGKREPSGGGSSERTPDYKPNPPTPPEGGNSDITGKELLSKINDLSPEEYEKHRDTIMKEAQQVKYEDQD